MRMKRSIRIESLFLLVLCAHFSFIQVSCEETGFLEPVLEPTPEVTETIETIPFGTDDSLQFYREELSSEQWRSSLQTLLEKHSDPTFSSIQRANISFLLGDFYAGLLDTSPGSIPAIDLSKAFSYYALASQSLINGVERAQYMMSFLLTYHPEAVPKEFTQLQKQIQSPKTNISPKKQDVPIALLYQQFAAFGGSVEAKAALASKLSNGHHTPPSCKKAITLYQQASLIEVSPIKMKPTISRSSDTAILSHEYQSGLNLLEGEEDIVALRTYSAENGDPESQVAIGLIHLEGNIGGAPRDYDRAFKFLKLAAEQDNPTGMTYLAYMYANGLGVEQDNYTAVALWRKAYENEGMGSADAATYLGIMTMNGWGTVKDRNEGIKLLQVAADSKSGNEPWAILQLALYAFQGSSGIKQDYFYARKEFERAALLGNMVAAYNLAFTVQNGFGIPASCPMATMYYKRVLEKTLYRRQCGDAFREFSEGKYERALIRYEMAADQGSILAQENAAWLYEMGFGLNLYSVPKIEQESSDSTDESTGLEKAPESSSQSASEPTPEHSIEQAPQSPPTQSTPPKTSSITDPLRTLESKRFENSFRLYQLAAEQQSPGAHLKLGDFKFYGLGTTLDISQAAQFYKIGSDLHSPQAAWNLGWMHQKGLGLPKDYHLAKRYYDQAMTNSFSIHKNKEAYVPSTLALAFLNIESFLDYLQVEGLVYGYEWDTAVLVVLSVFLLGALVVRHFLLQNEAVVVPHPEEQQFEPNPLPVNIDQN